MHLANKNKENLRRVNKYGVIGAMSLMIFIAIETIILFDNSNDFIIVFGYNGAVSEESMNIFENAVENEILKDNPDLDIDVKVDWLLFNPVSDPDNYNKLMTLLAQKNYSFYILSDQSQTIQGSEGASTYSGLSSMISSKGWFEALDKYGIAPDKQYNNRVQVNNSPLFEQIGLSETYFYASIVDWSEVSNNGKRDISCAKSVIKYLT